MIGQVKSDNAISDEILGSITITTTPTQDAIIAGVFAQFNGTQYDLIDRNCATAVAAALQAAGLKFDRSNIPYKLFLNLVKAFPPGHGSRVTYPNGVEGVPHGVGSIGNSNIGLLGATDTQGNPLFGFVVDLSQAGADEYQRSHPRQQH
jgi:hypothetical protein